MSFEKAVDQQLKACMRKMLKTPPGCNLYSKYHFIFVTGPVFVKCTTDACILFSNAMHTVSKHLDNVKKYAEQ